MRKHLRIGSMAASLLWLVGASSAAYADPGKLIVKANQPGVKISPMLYGLMTEEINHSYDGGLYAELIRNRVFKDSRSSPVGWSLVEESGGSGALVLDDTHPINKALTTCLKLDVTTASEHQRVGIANSGYWGIPVKPNTHYRASFFAKAGEGFQGPLTIDIESNDGATIYAQAAIPHLTTMWHQYTVSLTSPPSTPPASTCRFAITARSAGSVWFNQVSLMPPTYHHRPNGNRIDLMEKLAEMKPAFLRLPGGNYLEGNTIAERFEWKDTIHNISERPGHQGPWGYRSTDGLGLLEFLEWCEDLHMEPILAVYAGYSLQGEHIAPGSQLTPFVDDALDEIEYVSGSSKTHWGAVRAKDGHPAPFPLKYIEIGNEDEFDRSGSYDGRFTQFYDAIKAKYPSLQIIATTTVRTRTPDVIDDHYYRSAREMERDVHHYDNYARTGPKIFVGEWASTEGSPTPTLQAALGDAAWLTGMERNSDLVILSCYAPLLVNVNPGARQWGTNLIGYDAQDSFGSPSYYVQKMFNTNRGDVVLPVEVSPQNLPIATATPHPMGGVGVGTWLTEAEYKDIKVTHGDQVLYQKELADGLPGWDKGRGDWRFEEGAIRQSSGETDCRATTGDGNWTDYTYTLKARKLRGAEGFLVMFHVQDSDNYIWWNIGGWGNTRTALERARSGAKSEIGRVSGVTVETGKWYDVRIEVEGQRIRCYLDDKLITEATDALPPPPSPLYATASRDLASGDIILKVVNVDAAPQQLQIELQGIAQLRPIASLTVLSGNPGDVNSVANPERVAPIRSQIDHIAPTFLHEFPAHSVSVIRIKAE